MEKFIKSENFMRSIALFILFVLFVSANLFSQTTEEKKDFYSAYGLYEDDLYELAASSFENYLEKYPDSPRRGEALYYLGDCYFFLGKYEKAVSVYCSLKDSFPDQSVSREVGIRLAQANYYLGENQNALIGIDGYLKYFPEDPEAYYWKAEILYAMGKYVESEKNAERSLQLDTKGINAPYAQSLMIHTAVALKDTLSALSRCDDFIKKWNNTDLLFEILLLKGKLLTGLGKYDKALAIFEYVVDNAKEKDKRAESLFRSGEIYLRLKDYKSAQDSFSEITEKYSDTGWFDKSRYNLGWCLLRLERFTEAAEVFSASAIQAKDSTVKALSILKLGEVYNLSGQQHRARAAWKQLLKWPDGFEAKIQAEYELGVLDFRSGKYEEAIRHFTRVQKSWDKNLSRYSVKMLAESMLALGKTEEADKLFKSLSPQNQKMLAESLYQRGWISYKNKKWDKAEKIFKQVEKFSNYPSIYGLSNFWLGEIAFNVRKNYKQAAAYYLKSSEKQHKKRAEALYGYAWSLLKQKSYVKAEKAFQKILSLNLPSVLETDVKIRLADIAFLTKNYSLSVKRYKEVLEKQEITDEASRLYVLEQLAVSYRRLGKYDKARETYSKALKADPRREEYYKLKRAEALFESGRYADFISEINAVLPELKEPCLRSRAFYEEGDAFYNTGRYDKAINSYLKSIKEKECKKYRISSWSGILFSAVVSEAPQKADSALKLIEPILDKNEVFDFHIYYAKYLLSNNIYRNVDKILINAANAAEKKNNKAEAYRLLGIYYRNKGFEDKSLKAMEKSYGLFEKKEDKASLALSLIAEYREKSDFEKMKVWLDRFSELNISSGENKYEYELNRAYYLLTKNNIKKAKRVLKIAERNRVENSYLNVLETLIKAQIEFHNANLPEAEKLLESILTNRSDRFAAESQLWLGYIYEKKKMPEKAVENFLKVRYLYRGYKELVARAMYEAARIEILSDRKSKAEKIIGKMKKEFGDSPWTKKASTLK